MDPATPVGSPNKNAVKMPLTPDELGKEEVTQCSSVAADTQTATVLVVAETSEGLLPVLSPASETNNKHTEEKLSTIVQSSTVTMPERSTTPVEDIDTMPESSTTPVKDIENNDAIDAAQLNGPEISGSTDQLPDDATQNASSTPDVGTMANTIANSSAAAAGPLKVKFKYSSVSGVDSYIDKEMLLLGLAKMVGFYHPSPADPNEQKRVSNKDCTVCGEESLFSCLNCKGVRFCSAECAMTDWKYHSLICESYKHMPPRPSPYHVLAVVFQVNETKPSLAWFRQPIFHTSGGDLAIVLNTFADTPQVLVELQRLARVKKNFVRNTNLKNHLRISGGVALATDAVQSKYPVNKGVMNAIAKTKRYTEKDPNLTWRGPVIIALHDGDTNFYKSMTPYDFSQAVDYLSCGADLADGEESGPNAPDVILATDKNRVILPLKRAKKVMGVRIHCPIDAANFDIPMFESVPVPQDHPVAFSTATPTWTVPSLIGIPLKVLLMHHHGEVCDGRLGVTAPLFLLFDPTDEDKFGSKSDDLECLNMCDSCAVVIREDGCDLLPEQLSLITSFVVDVAMGCVDDALDAIPRQAGRRTGDDLEKFRTEVLEKAVGQIGKDAFLKYFKDICRLNCCNLPSPYQMEPSVWDKAEEMIEDAKTK